MAKKTGLRAAILNVMKSKDEFYVQEIAAILNMDSCLVSNSMREMKNIYRIKSFYKRKPRYIYSLKPFQGVIEEVIKPVVKDKPKRYVPTFTPMSEQAYDLYAGRNLAMLAR